MAWPPQIGEPLPRAGDAWYELRKLEWILGPEGHGSEWQRVFRVDFGDRQWIWAAIAGAMPTVTIKEVRVRGYGVTCGVEVELTINGRVAQTLVSWHYAIKGAAPRLVTAYPTP